MSRGECGGDACIACGVSREWREVAALLNSSSFPARDDKCF